MRGAEAERQAEAERNSPPPPPPTPLGGTIQAAAADLHSGKGAWLGSRQNLAKMSGGLDKTDYERLIHLVSQNDPP